MILERSNTGDRCGKCCLKKEFHGVLCENCSKNLQNLTPEDFWDFRLPQKFCERRIYGYSD